MLEMFAGKVQYLWPWQTSPTGEPQRQPRAERAGELSVPPCRSNDIHLQAAPAADIRRPFVPCRRRLLEDTVETIQIEVWTTIYPARNIAPQQLWQKVEPPDTRMWEATKFHGFPMNITFLNATSYQVGNTQPILPFLAPHTMPRCGQLIMHLFVAPSSKP